MTQNQDDREPQLRDSAKPKQRKPYKKPSFRFENIFETMALSCGKVNASQAGCKLNRKSS